MAEDIFCNLILPELFNQNPKGGSLGESLGHGGVIGFVGARNSRNWNAMAAESCDRYNVVGGVCPAMAAASKSAGGGTAFTAQSGDPNEKIGPSGVGTAGCISGDGMFAYRVDFENEASVTAPAQIVNVTDQLDSDLDWAASR